MKTEGNELEKSWRLSDWLLPGGSFLAALREKRRQMWLAEAHQDKG